MGYVGSFEGVGKTPSEPSLFSMEQMVWLQKLICQSSSSTVIATGTTTQKGAFLYALHAQAEDQVIVSCLSSIFASLEKLLSYNLKI